LSISGCSSHSNKEIFNVKIGESFKIYYSTNSCCYYWWINEKKIKSVKLSGRTMEKETPKGCTGCSSKSAFLFKAMAIGTDTIKLSMLTATDSCNEESVDYEAYVVNVAR
jgi:predicted secreted protein